MIGGELQNNAGVVGGQAPTLGEVGTAATAASELV